MKSQPLGKGLQALFEDTKLSDYIDSGKKFLDVPVDAILPNPLQPRERFDSNQIETLKNSIKNSGLIQPIAVRQVNDKYEIVAGERRWRAVKALKIPTIPAYVLKVDNNRKLLELSLLENVKREDLNPIEIAVGFKRLSDEFNMTQQELSEAFSVDRSTVANSMRLLNLPEEIQEKVKSGELSMGHARALLGCDDQKDLLELADRIIREQLNVRQTESLLRSPGQKKKKTACKRIRKKCGSNAA
jgi:ParB family chromosome partitioning protein